MHRSNASRTIMMLTMLMLSHTLIHAQNTPVTHISGTVADSATNDPIAYATVTVMDGEMVPVNAVAADMAGRFSLPLKTTGKFKLVVSHVGYTSSITDIEIKEGEKKTDVGTIKITEGEELEGIKVTAQRPLIKVEPDKLVYSVDADPEKDHSTLAEVLRKVPQLSLNAEEKVLLNGQSNYKVLVNGKSTSMISRNFDEVIKSLPASSIKDIQVITDPSTKYEAEGVGGIINIIMHNSRIGGYSGRIGAGITSRGDKGANAYIAAQLGKFNFSLSYYGNEYRNTESSGSMEYTSYNTPEEYLQKTTSKGEIDGRNHSLDLEASYEIDSLNLISLSFGAYASIYNPNIMSEGRTYNQAGELVKQFAGNIRNDNKYGYLNGGLDYQRTFKKPDRLFTVSYRLEGHPVDSYRFDDLTGILNYTSKREKSSNKSNGTEHTVQIDYFDPLTEAHQIEAGVKYILRTNDSDIEEYKLEDDEWVINTVRLGGLDYTQHILGLYGGYLYNRKKFTAKAGFRIEGTWNDGTASAGGENYLFDNSNLNIVPYVNFTYMVKPSQRLRTSYTQRLTRPGISELNPYVERDEYNTSMISYGNPDLKTVVSHRFSLGYSVFGTSWNMDLSASASFSNNDITQFTKETGDGQEKLIETTHANIGKLQNYMLNASLGYNPSSVLMLYANASVGYSIIGAPSMGLNNEGVSGNISLGGNVALWKDAHLAVNASAYWPGVDLQGSSSTFLWSGFGISQKLFKQKLDLNLNVSQPFSEKLKSRSTIEMPGVFKTVNRSEYTLRNISLRVGYRFGKMDVNVKKARRGISNDDKPANTAKGAGAK